MFDFGLVSLPVIALSALFGYAVLFDVDSVLFHEIEVPASLEYQGYTPKVMASRMAQEVKAIKREARTAREMRQFNLPDEESPIQALGRYYNFLTPIVATQELMGLVEFSFVGNMVKSKDGLKLTVHGLNTKTNRAFHSTVSGADPEELVKKAALDATRFIDPYIVASYHYERTVASGSSDFTQTVEELKHCMHALPDEDQHWVHNLWGLVQLRQGKFDNAVEEFNTALRIKPDFVLSVHNLGRVHMAKGEYENAIGKFKEVLAMDAVGRVRTPHAYTLWGDALVALGRPDEAAKMYDMAIRVEPDYPDSYNSYGKLLMSQGKRGEARIMHDLALKLEPTRVEFRQAVEQFTN
ncbi:tetratricopeptide repeat protein [Azospirillum halopraeferens]|uniref:tetratricopeptide repeat protein n=1 Tax=Azospirillum halopraeferens TaxID=34010 RepID=UPI000410527A|nr:tetratricopeptide repeat protein [Azospirillum halopraeferens]